jgi:hypothetical protein
MADTTSVVLFSGGRDSSLAACLEANQGQSLKLLTALTGATIETDVVRYRVAEIRQAFPSIDLEWRERQCAGLFRRVALADIEADFARYHTNLILLGHQLTIQTEAIVYCLEQRLTRMVSGFSSYQTPAFMEQTPEAIAISKEFCDGYGISFETPITLYASLDDVKFQLLDFGVTTKSLEAVSLFADTFSRATAENIVHYLEAKLPICHEYIRLKTSGLH